MSEQYSDEASRPRGGMPVWGWIMIGCGGVFILLLAGIAIMGAILFPVFAQARERARQASCMSNIRQLSLAMQMYAQDYDDRLPLRARWMDSLLPYTKNEALLHCPSVRPGGQTSYGYAFNSPLAGKKRSKLPSPATTPVLYDSRNLARNASDPMTSLPNPPRHLGNVIGYADGHVRAAAPQRLPSSP
jgi:type II secretory pathway pseudopilin PulG